MERGWDASGRLELFWDRVGGRDGLASKTGIAATQLSGYNTRNPEARRNLGIKNGALIAEALGVTIQDLGAPPTDQQIAPVRRRQLVILGVALAAPVIVLVGWAVRAWG